MRLGLPMGFSNFVEISAFSLVALLVAQLGATVVAVGRGEAKLAQARELGAHVTAHSSDGAEAIIAAAGGQIDVVLQCVGENTAMDRLAIDIAGYRGRVVFIAVSSDSMM